MKHKRNSMLARLNIVRRWKLGEIDRDQARAELDKLRSRDAIRTNQRD